MSWFNGNRTLLPIMINHHERREVHAKEASQLQPRREGLYPEAAPGWPGSGFRSVRRIELQPKIFYGWQRQFFEQGASVFAPEGKGKEQGQERRIGELEEKLRRKHEVLSELLEEHIQLKKELGEL